MKEQDIKGKKRLGKLLRNCREGLELSQQQVADYLHIDRTTYTKYEGGRLPDMKSLIELAELYRVELTVFASCFTVSQEPKPVSAAFSSPNGTTLKDDEDYLPLPDDEKRLLTYYRNCIRKRTINEYAKVVMIEDASGLWADIDE